MIKPVTLPPAMYVLDFAGNLSRGLTKKDRDVTIRKMPKSIENTSWLLITPNWCSDTTGEQYILTSTKLEHCGACCRPTAHVLNNCTSFKVAVREEIHSINRDFAHCKCDSCNHENRMQCIANKCYCCDLEDAFSLATHVDFTKETCG